MVQLLVHERRLTPSMVYITLVIVTHYGKTDHS